MTKRLIRIRAVCERTGLAKSTVHEHVARGLLPPAIKISRSWGAWWDHEIDQVVSARIASWSDDQLRRLVKRLVAARKCVAPDIAIEGGGYESTRETPEGSGAPRALDQMHELE